MLKYFPFFVLHKPHTGTKDQFLQKKPSQDFDNVCKKNWELVDGATFWKRERGRSPSRNGVGTRREACLGVSHSKNYNAFIPHLIGNNLLRKPHRSLHINISMFEPCAHLTGNYFKV